MERSVRFSRFSPRARHRLLIARRLLRFRTPATLDGGDQECIGVLTRIQRMSERKRQALRDQVDWVEDYEHQEQEASRRRS